MLLSTGSIRIHSGISYLPPTTGSNQQTDRNKGNHIYRVATAPANGDSDSYEYKMIYWGRSILLLTDERC
jgi:hypothetical protein